MDKLVRVYKPDGSVEDYDRVVPYDELVEIVGGYLELIKVAPGVQLVCDDEGLFKGHSPCLCLKAPFRDILLVGNIVVGNYSGVGMKPISESKIKTFESHIVRSRTCD